MTTGIYGGSFNPIHLGHTSLGSWLVRQNLLDELWLLVSPHNPLKPAAGLLEDQARLRLARLAVGRKKGLRVSDFEFSLPRPSFMAHTLSCLREAHPDRDFVLVIGADNWIDFPRWRQPEEILRHHRLLIYPRPGYPIDPSTLPDGVMMVETPLLDISSTMVREAIAHNPDYDGNGLDPRVWQEIKRKQYYFAKE